jgi:uncharacterized protein DUF4384
MSAHLAVLSLLAISGPPVARPGALYRPHIEVWTNRGDDPFTSGQRARVFFRTETDAYVTVLRVDTDGRVRVLFPFAPWQDNIGRGGLEYEVRGGYEPDAFSVDDYPGVGYIFAVSSADPFVYDALETGDHWDYRVVADGRVRGDPYVALTELARRILPADYGDWDYDLTPYYVERHYDYPRFLCYDCHADVSYPLWPVYDYSCVRFRIVVFDDPYYYPYRYYGGTRVVFTRPYRPAPRFIFKDRSRTDVFITRVRERPVNDDPRRDVGVSGRDLGGIGIIPPPRRQADITGDDDRRQGEARNDARRREHPDQPDRPEPPAVRRSDGRAVGGEPRVEPRREAPPPPTSQPRVEPRRDAPKEKPQRNDPELKRRKP